MNFHLDVKNIKEVEYYILLNLIGVLSALYRGAISINDAQKLIFSPRYAEGAKKLRVNPNIVKIIWQGTELEDVESLCPKDLPETILELKTKALGLCKKHSKPDDQLEKMTVTIDGVFHTMLEGFSDIVVIEEE